MSNDFSLQRTLMKNIKFMKEIELSLLLKYTNNVFYLGVVTSPSFCTKKYKDRTL
jgi:hypothetical protein